MPYTYQWVDRLLFPQVTQSESWSLTLQNETTLFFCLLNPDWGLFQLPEWLSQCGTYTAFRISVSYPWQGEPKNLSNRVCVGGVSEHAKSLKEKRTNGSIRQNTVDKRGKNKRQWKTVRDESRFFFRSTSSDEWSEGDRLHCCGCGPPQGAEPATAVTTFPMHLYIVL